MPSKELADDLELTKNLKILITTNEEISVMRMQRIRDAVLKTRHFIDGLVEVYGDVKASHHTLLQSMRQRWAKKEAPERRKPLLILISSAARFSGSISQEIFSLFLRAVDKESEADVVIAGRVGRDMFSAARPGIKFKFIDLPEASLETQEMADLVEEAQKYKNVRIFYGRFLNLIDQIPAETDLSDLSEAEALNPEQNSQQKLYYMFEPNLPVVMKYFDDQILGALVTQAAHESRLAVLGSRVTAMEASAQRVNDKLRDLENLARSERKNERNDQQRTLMAGISLWGR